MSSMRHECASVSELMTLVSSMRLTASHCVSLRLFVLSLSAADLAAFHVSVDVVAVYLRMYVVFVFWC